MYILLDIGGTNTRVAFSKTGEKIDEISRLTTTSNFDEALQEIENLIQEKEWGLVEGICAGLASPLDDEHSGSVNAPNLPLWNNQPLRARLEQITGASVILENDCVLAGMGEAHFGAGKNVDILAYITVSTGVGGARIVKGIPDVNRYGFEPGHQILSFEDKKVTLENLVSGTAIEKKYGVKAEFMDDPREWEKIAEYLAIGLNNILVHWSPDKIILGGSVMNKVDLEILRKKFREVVFIFPELPIIEKAELEDPVLWGGLARLQQGRFNNQNSS